MQAGATAAKVCGAGGVVRLPLQVLGHPIGRTAIAEAPLPGGGARVLDYTFEQHGLVRG